MLVLTRKIKESVVLGGSEAFDRILRITVLEVRGGNVRLGFEVDRDIPVHRAEIWARLHGAPNTVPARAGPIENGAAVSPRISDPRD